MEERKSLTESGNSEGVIEERERDGTRVEDDKVRWKYERRT